MKTNNRSMALSSLVIIMLIFFSWSATATTDMLVKKREYNKSFNVGSGDVVKTDNRYGNTTIQYGSDGTVSIRVVVEAKSGSEKKIQEMLDRVHIRMEKTGSTVNAVTEITSKSINMNNGESFSINYYVTIPRAFTCDLTQKYGNINMPQSNAGKCLLNCKYGNISGGDFSGPLNIDSKYGNIKIENVQQTDIDIQYGNVEISTLQDGKIESKYGNVKIRQVASRLEMPGFSYGNLNISDVAAGFKQINIDSRYGKADIGAPHSLSFRVEAKNLKYGSCKVKGFDSLAKSSQNANDYDSDDDKNKETMLSINGGRGGKIYFDGNSYSSLRVNAN